MPATDDERARGQAVAYLALAGGVVAFSTSGALTKLCGAPAITIAFWVRVFSVAYLASALLLTAGRDSKRRLRTATRSGGVGGLLFAVHLIFFFLALKLTSVTVVFLLGALNPAVVAVAGAVLFGERLSARQVVWTVVAIAAAAVVVATRDAPGGGQALGNFFAVLATLGYCAYFLVSRQARQAVGTLEYLTAATTTSLVAIGAVGVLAGVPFSPGGAHDLWLMALIGLIPATTGHLLVNFALRHVAAHQASMVLLAVPLFASLWAYLLVGERVSAVQMAAAAAVLIAIPGAVRQPAVH